MTDQNRNALKAALRTAMLPILSEREDACIDQAISYIAQHFPTLSEEEYPNWMFLHLEKWLDDNDILSQRQLKPIFQLIIRTGTDTEEHRIVGERLATDYFTIHKWLIEQERIGKRLASAFLSHCLLIYHLRTQGKMSAAQISRLLAKRDTRLTLRWQTTRGLLSKLGCAQEIDVPAMNQLCQDDILMAEERFADANIFDANEIITTFGGLVGLHANDLQNALDDIVPTEESTLIFRPYFELLYFQCLLAEFYDFPMTNAYEFHPRGEFVTQLLQTLPGNQNPGNPFLNNAKSEDQLDLSWANSKQSSNYFSARGLATLLMAMEDLSFAARRELARLIRYWVRRVLQCRQLPDNLLNLYNDAEAQRLIQSIVANETNTSGILEQRLVDFYAASTYGPDWYGRGIGDSVHATNTSRKKLGDCDFQRVSVINNTQSVAVHAFEAHGGRLTQVYYEEHKRTLRNALKVRLENEWQGLGISPNNCHLTVFYICNSIDAAIVAPENLTIHGVSVQLNKQLFAEVMDNFAIDIEKFNRFMIMPLNESRTPQRIRGIASQLTQ